MFGSPTPTKQTCCPASSRAAATIIISDFEKAGSVMSLTGTPRSRPTPDGAAPLGRSDATRSAPSFSTYAARPSRS